MNFRLQKRILLLGTIVTLILTSAVFTYFIHKNHETTKIQLIEDKLKGDAKSILPHLYLSGNSAWFKDNLEQYKKFGLNCISIKDTANNLIWGDRGPCEKSITSKNYVDQEVFKIFYSLPTISVLSTIETNGKSFIIFFLIQITFLGLAYALLSAINKRHSDTLIQIEHIKSLNESNEKILTLTRTLSHNLKSPLAALKSLYELASDKLNPDENELLTSIQSNINMMASRLMNRDEEVLPTSIVDISKAIEHVSNMKMLEIKKFDNIHIENNVQPHLFGPANETELIRAWCALTGAPKLHFS